MAWFKSFLMAGFECSTHYLADRTRLDLVASTKHDVFMERDYQRLRSQGILTAREGLRWHLIEAKPGQYDFSTALKVIETSRKVGIQVIWDVFHYGWPDHMDIMAPDFVDRFAAFSGAFARFYREHSDEPLWACPVNEISFLAWGGGDTASLNPYLLGRGQQLKEILVRASIAGADSILNVAGGTRLIQIEPVINIIPNPHLPRRRPYIEGYNEAQFDAWKMLGGQLNADLGGSPRYLDVIGINYYPRNQWVDHGLKLKTTHPLYKPLRQILKDLYLRFGRPMFIAETGTENDKRPDWFSYVVQETVAAIKSGVPIHGICLYPIVNHPGWLDNRHCHNGLWDYADEDGEREIYQPFADEIRKQWPALKAAEEMMELMENGSAIQSRSLELDQQAADVSV